MKRLLALSIAAILTPALVFSGCMKKPETNKDFGPEVSLDEIQQAISTDAPMDLNRLRAGQYVSLDEIQVLNTQIPSTVTQRVDEIKTFADHPDHVQLGFQVTLKELVNGAWKESTQPFNLAVGKANSVNQTAATSDSNGTPAKDSSAQVSIQSLKKQDSSSQYRVTYHNLKRVVDRMPVPEVVKAHGNWCGSANVNTSPCPPSLGYLQVSFDRVVWDSDENPTKTILKITYSPDIPPYIHDWDDTSELYFTNQIQTCAQTWLELSDGTNTQTVPVLQCIDVKDFKFGL